MYGINGENYTLNGKYIVMPENKASFSGWGGSDAFTNIDYIRSTASDTPDYKEKYYEIAQLNAKYYPSTGFEFDEKQLESINDMMQTRAKSFYEFERTLVSGSQTSIEDFIAEQKNLGVDTILVNMQSQLDNWRENKK